MSDPILLTVTPTQLVTPIELPAGLWKIYAPAQVRFKQAASWSRFAIAPNAPTVTPSIVHPFPVFAQLNLEGLGGQTNVPASLDLGTLTGGNWNTTVAALVAGANGNDIQVSSAGDSGGGVFLEEGGNLVHIRFDDGVSTVAEAETAIGGSTLIQVQAAGTGGNILSGGFGATNLAGGNGRLATVVRARTAGVLGNNITVESTTLGAAPGVILIEAGNAQLLEYQALTALTTEFESVINTSILMEVLTPSPQPNNSPDGTGVFGATNLAGGAAGDATDHAYKIVSVMPDGGKSLPSAAGSTLVGAPVLGGPEFNTIAWAATTGAVSYEVYRTAGPYALGLIGSTAALSFIDTGIPGTTAIPTAATSVGRLIPSGALPAYIFVTGASTAFINAKSISGTVVMELLADPPTPP